MKKLAIFLLVLSMAVSFAFAQGGSEVDRSAKYPERTISIIVPAKTGGDCDQVTRIITPGLAENLGVSVVAENVDGGAGNLALARLLQNEADGYQFALFNGAIFTGELAGSFKYSLDEFIPVCTIAQNDTQILVANAKGKYNTVEALANAVKTAPGTVKFAATMGAPSQIHAVATENAMGGKFKKVDVASGSSKLVALLSGEVDIVSSTHSLVKDYVQKGEIVALASICTERSAFGPDTPTFKELGYDLGPNFAATYVLMAKKGTPDYVIEKICKAVEAEMSDAETVKILNNLNYTPAVRCGEEAVEWFNTERNAYLSMKEAIANDKW